MLESVFAITITRIATTPNNSIPISVRTLQSTSLERWELTNVNNLVRYLGIDAFQYAFCHTAKAKVLLHCTESFRRQDKTLEHLCTSLALLSSGVQYIRWIPM